MLLPEKDALVAHCHVQTVSSFGAHLASPFVGSQPENWFSDGIHQISVGSQDVSAPDKCGISPVRFHAKMGRF
jgi:hypothetical protein